MIALGLRMCETTCRNLVSFKDQARLYCLVLDQLEVSDHTGALYPCAL